MRVEANPVGTVGYHLTSAIIENKPELCGYARRTQLVGDYDSATHEPFCLHAADGRARFSDACGKEHGVQLAELLETEGKRRMVARVWFVGREP